MAYQIRDVIDRMEADSGIALAELKVDGGAAMNDFVLQFQADQLGVEVLRPKVIDTTARGAAFLAGLAVGYWKDKADLHTAFALDRAFKPSSDRASADKLYRGWCRTVDRSRDWAEHD
jgi:glycerol kinase